MIYGIIIYVLIMLLISFYDMKKIKSFEDYSLAGKNQSFIFVFASLMATMIGASATIGIGDKVVEIGFPAFWWLFVGAFGMIAQALFISEKIRNLNANTLPDIANITVGKEAKTLLAVIIPISWIGIVSAQFVALTKIIRHYSKDIGENKILIIVAVTVIIYTLVGGQISVIKTDMLQAWVIALGIIATFLYLFINSGNNGEVFSQIELFNHKFRINDLIATLLVVGGTYFLGPDIISRNLVSKDSKTAKKAALTSGVCLGVFAVIVTLAALWAVINCDGLSGENPLIYIMNNNLPKPLAVLFCLTLISTIVSSADTCLVNAATIIENDLLKKNKVWHVRIIILIIGLIALVMSINNKDVIGLLTGAYSIYAPGIVFPLLIAILCYGKRKVNKKLWFTGVLIGGTMGAVSTYFGMGEWGIPLAGMMISLIFGVASVNPMKK